MRQSLEILKVFNTLTLKQIFWKTITFFKKLEYRFLVVRLKTRFFYTKLPCQKPMLRRIEWWVQNGALIKNVILQVTTLFFRNFCFILRTSCKELIWCTNYPNIHFCTFCKRWSFIWQCFFPVSILKAIVIINRT